MTSSNEDRPTVSRGVLAAAALVVALVLAGLVLSVSNLLSKDDPDPASSAPPAPSSSSVEPAKDSSVCGLKAVQTTGSVAKAPQATWTLVGTTAAPAIKGQGPGRVEDDGFRSCYAHTPLGSLLAASNLLAMGSDSGLGSKVTERLTVPGPGRTAALAQSDATRDATGTRIQIEGFRIISYRANTANIDLAFRTSNGALGAQAFTLNWVQGDWKVVLDPSGELPSPLSQIPSISGYIAWAGV